MNIDDFDFAVTVAEKIGSVTLNKEELLWLVNQIKTPIDAEPVRHGEWISMPHKIARICSRCGKDEPYKFAYDNADVYDYCPHCGAKMDGERKEE